MNKIIKALIFIITQVSGWLLPLLFLYTILECTKDGLVVSYITAVHLGVLFTFIFAISHHLLTDLKNKYNYNK